MTHSGKFKALLPLLLLAVVAAVVLGTVAAVPYDVPATQPPNTYGNLFNGGVVAEDGSMLYYVNGKGVLYCLSSPNSYRIDEQADSLCPYGNGLIYRKQNGEVRYSNFRGEEKHTLISGVTQMAVNGNWIFFTREDGILHKYSVLSGEEFSLGLAVRQFLIASNAVLYADREGYLNTARTDGSNSERFFTEKVDGFMRFESYVFYTRDGMLYSMASANAASKKTYFPVLEFNITESGILVFTDDAGLHTCDLTEDSESVLDLEVQGGPARQLSVWGDNILYYNSEEQLVCCLKDGSEWHYM